MLTQQDTEMLIMTGKKVKETRYSIAEVVKMIRDTAPYFGPTIQTLCFNDDGRIDPDERKLIQWSRNFVFRVPPSDAMECESYLLEGYSS